MGAIGDRLISRQTKKSGDATVDALRELAAEQQTTNHLLMMLIAVVAPNTPEGVWARQQLPAVPRQ